MEYSMAWKEPDNYTTRKFFTQYATFLDYSTRISFFNYNRSIKDVIRSLTSLSGGRVGVIWGFDMDDPIFVESIVFKYRLSDGRVCQVEVNMKKTSLFMLFEKLLTIGVSTSILKNMLFGKMQYIWRDLLINELSSPDYGICKEDLSTIKEWIKIA